MSAPSNLLTDAELDALAQDVASGAYDNEAGYNIQKNVRKHDLASEGSNLGVNLSAIDMINERFVRQFRSGMLESLRTSPRVMANKVSIIKYGSYLKGLQPPLSVNVVRSRNLRCLSTVVIEPSLVFSSLDSFFGGLGKGAAELTPGRLFTPTEQRIINLILGVLFQSLMDSWGPLMPADFELVSSEINPQFVQIADDDDLIVLSRFETENADKKGFIDIAYPYAALKPVRDLMRSRVQTSSGSDEADTIWRDEMTNAVYDSSVTINVMMGELDITLAQLEHLTEGQTLYFRKPEFSTMYINGTPAYAATVGAMGTQTAIQIQRVLTKGLV